MGWPGPMPAKAPFAQGLCRAAAKWVQSGHYAPLLARPKHRYGETPQRRCTQWPFGKCTKGKAIMAKRLVKTLVDAQRQLPT